MTSICKEFSHGGMGCRVLDGQPKTEIVYCTLTKGYGIYYDLPLITTPIRVKGERPTACKYARDHDAVCGWYPIHEED